MWILAFIILGIFAIPLLAYPAVLLAGVMGLGGYRSGNESALLILVSRSFLLGTLAYPIVYSICVKAAWNAADPEVLAWGLSPAAYLALLWLLFGAWRRLEKSSA